MANDRLKMAKGRGIQRRDAKSAEGRKVSAKPGVIRVLRAKHDYSDEWYTPPEIPKALGRFDLDPCAGPSCHARRNIRRPKCGLQVAWRGRIWLNPPYSDIQPWLTRFLEHGNGIALVNARCETLWFQRLAAKADGLLMIRRRVKFTSDRLTESGPTVGSILVALGGGNAEALRESGIEGLFLTRNTQHATRARYES